jgi:hypothetical protein
MYDSNSLLMVSTGWEGVILLNFNTPCFSGFPWPLYLVLSFTRLYGYRHGHLEKTQTKVLFSLWVRNSTNEFALGIAEQILCCVVLVLLVEDLAGQTRYLDRKGVHPSKNGYIRLCRSFSRALGPEKHSPRSDAYLCHFHPPGEL